MLKNLMIALFCCAICLGTVRADDQLNRRSGQVLAEDGKPIAGAMVRTIEASASVKEDQLCPSVFPGLDKTYTTDAEGKYELIDIHPRLKYEVVITAAGYKPHVIEEMSGWVTKPLTNKLRAVPEKIDLSDQVTGKVSDENGKPLAGTVIEFFGEIKGNGNSRSQQFGGLTDVDPCAVTGEDGTFVCEAKGGPRKFFTKIHSLGFAPMVMQMQTGSDAPDGIDVRLSRGCSVTGRLVKDGHPLAGVEIMLSQVNLNSEQCFGFFSIGTDADGKFTFEHLPETEDYQVWAAMSSLGSRGATGEVKVKTGAVAGVPAEIGDVPVGPAVTISGQCLLPSGLTSFKGITVSVSANSADANSVQVAEDGSFKITGIKPGSVSLRVFGQKVELSEENASYLAGAHEMLGKVEQDTTLKLKLIARPDGPQESHGYSGNEYEAKKSEPLQGVSEEEKR